MSVPYIDFVEEARKDIAEGDIDGCVDKIKTGLKAPDNNLVNQLNLLSKSTFQLKEDALSGIISDKKSKHTQNIICKSLLNLLEVIEANQLDASVDAELKLKDVNIAEKQGDYIDAVTKILEFELKTKDAKSEDIIGLTVKGQTLHKIKSLIQLELLPKACVSCITVNNNIEDYYTVLVKLGIYDLIGLNLKEVDLKEANLSRADLSQANLIGANLSRANLQGANLSQANLTGANLIAADVQEANLQEANLTEVDLRGGNLRKANLSQANLQEGDLRGVNLRKANLQGANLSWANLNWADLIETNLQEANFEGARLVGAKFHINDRLVVIAHGISTDNLVFIGEESSI